MSLDPSRWCSPRVTAERLGELVLARRNTAALIAQGGVERGAGHYPLIVALHAAWLVGLWWLVAGGAGRRSAGWRCSVLQIGRVWVLATLGPALDDAHHRRARRDAGATGPYRFMAHPNYVVVAAEILVLPLVFGLVWYGILFSVLNAAILWIRIRAEAAALRRG